MSDIECKLIVSPLDWNDDGDWDGEECSANSIVGQYMIVSSMMAGGDDKCRVILNYLSDGSVYQTQLVDGVTAAQARAFADVHYEQCILSVVTLAKAGGQP